MSRTQTALALTTLTCIVTPTARAQTSTAGSNSLRDCDATRPTLAEAKDLRCFESKHTWVFSNDTAWARRVIDATEVAASRFERVFGKTIRRGAVVHIANQDTGTTMVVQQNSTDVPWIWRWTSIGGAAESGINTHEMGHIWLAGSFSWPVRPGSGYGTTGADWLDETGAVLMEDDASRAIRRTNFLQNYRAQSSGGPKLIKPLEELFTMNHPGFGPDSSADSGYASNTRSSLDIPDSVLSSPDSMQAWITRTMKNTTRDPIRVEAFYGQCQLFVDFLVERTKDPTVFGAIASNEAAGSNVKEWLQKNGSHYNLPTTVEELEKEWQKWLAEWAAKGVVQSPKAP